MVKVYLSLGSNIGRRPDNIKKALEMLRECGISILKESRLYETKAVSKVPQRNFLNICVEVQTIFKPEKLLDICKSVEKEMGRKKTTKKRAGYEKPRIIDIDILTYNNEIINKKNLHIPHPQMHLRGFVLEPLNEIAPYLKIPPQQKTVNELLKELYK